MGSGTKITSDFSDITIVILVIPEKNCNMREKMAWNQKITKITVVNHYSDFSDS